MLHTITQTMDVNLRASGSIILKQQLHGLCILAAPEIHEFSGLKIYESRLLL